jgi:phosphate transport system substrate-binding protein
VAVSYSAVGSSAGIAAFSARQVDFGASDVPMTASEQAGARGGPVVQVPVDMGAEGVAYNLNLPAGTRLHLTGPVIARIYLGQITRWDDQAIAALNPGITLPSARITVVHRSDGNGTTYIFSDYLSSVDPAWAAREGRGKSLNWSTGEGDEGKRRGGQRGVPHAVLYRIHRAVLYPGPAAPVRRDPQPGRPVRPSVPAVRRR